MLFSDLLEQFRIEVEQEEGGLNIVQEEGEEGEIGPHKKVKLGNTLVNFETQLTEIKEKVTRGFDGFEKLNHETEERSMLR
jgi:hypothetical protein